MYNGRSAITAIKSLTIGRFTKYNYDEWKPEGPLDLLDPTVTIAPASARLGFDQSPYYHISTVLVGTRIVVAYPPNEVNVSTLTEQNDPFARNWLDTRLQHGIAIIQPRGQILTTPPFWVWNAITPTVCVTTTWKILTAEKFPQRLQLINSCLDRGKRELWEPKLRLLAQLFRRIVNNEIPDFENDRIMANLYRWWDARYWFPLTMICDAIPDKAKREYVVKTFNDMFLKYALPKRGKKNTCTLCQFVCSEKRGTYAREGVIGEGTMEETLNKHVPDQHGL
jgi:hypothetical protein